MEGDLAGGIRLDHLGDPLGGDSLADQPFRFIRDDEIPTDPLEVAARGERQRPALQRHGVERDPGGGAQRRSHRPILLIGMPRREAPSGLLEECLIVPHPHARRTEERRGDSGQPPRPAHGPGLVRLQPQVEDLNEGLAVGVARLHRHAGEGVVGLDEPADRAVDPGERRAGEHPRHLQVALLTKPTALVVSDGERGFEFGGHIGRHDIHR